MASGFAPILHFYLVEGSEGVRPFPFWHTVAMELWYSAGTFFYLTHWPEKQFPETFDIFVRVLSVLISGMGMLIYPCGIGSKPSDLPYPDRDRSVCVFPGAEGTLGDAYRVTNEA